MVTVKPAAAAGMRTLLLAAAGFAAHAGCAGAGDVGPDQAELHRELHAAFQLRDRDGDGDVTLGELAAGIQSSLEIEWAARPAAAPPPPPAHPFGRAQCEDPTLDALSFVECAVHRARVELDGNNASVRLQPVAFAAQLDSYLAGCETPTAAWLSGDCMGSCAACCAKPEASATALETVPEIAASEGPFTTVLISSDWHTEPWYVSSAAAGCGAVCRFGDANLSNMFTCQDGHNATVPCTLDGKQDPPIEFEESHLASAAVAAATVHFFVGDTQAHSFTGQWSQPEAISTLLNRVLTAELRQFGSASNIVWTPGNNDGPHSAIFQQQDASTIAWANALLSHGIVTDDLGFVYPIDSPNSLSVSS
jgi:hypothetical protein